MNLFYSLPLMLFTFMEIPSAPCIKSFYFFLVDSIDIRMNFMTVEKTSPGAIQCVGLKMKPDIDSSLAFDPRSHDKF